MGHCNVENRTIFCKDNLDVLRGINSACIDLIYLDPPFNKKKMFTAPIGSTAEGAGFKDIFRREDVKDEWLKIIKEDNDKLHTFLESTKKMEGRTSYNYCYLAYMAIRLMEMHRVLKDTGSLYLHCDPTMSHYLKLLMDIIFDEKNFRNELVWHYGGTGRGKKFPQKHDVLLFYSRTDNYAFNAVYVKAKKASGWTGKTEKLCDSVWDMGTVFQSPQRATRTGYPTEKPVPLLKRIIKASSQTGDVVLDPFCGCATTCVAAEPLDRQWIGVDVYEKTFHIVRERLEKELAQPSYVWDKNKKLHFLREAPKRTDSGAHPTQKVPCLRSRL